ncbi:MAG TPA: hypothetical protein ENK06_04915 [Gammaproteobacteria bacterium]|nr:hypothetical protein [Gammaproteobacteria bacterium]
MKDIILACIALFVGVLLAGIPPVTAFLDANDLHFLTQAHYLVPAYFFFVLLTIKGIYRITEYTDETIPLKLGVLAVILSIAGLAWFFRLLILGALILIVAAYWNQGIVKSYYPRVRR